MSRFTVPRALAVLILSVVFGAAAACSRSGSAVQGTYTNANGMATLELKSGEQASFTLMGENHACAYKEDAGKITLTCPGQDALELTVHEDGSLTPTGTLIGTMTKSKS